MPKRGQQLSKKGGESSREGFVHSRQSWICCRHHQTLGIILWRPVGAQAQARQTRAPNKDAAQLPGKARPFQALIAMVALAWPPLNFLKPRGVCFGSPVQAGSRLSSPCKFYKHPGDESRDLSGAANTELFKEPFPSRMGREASLQECIYIPVCVRTAPMPRPGTSWDMGSTLATGLVARLLLPTAPASQALVLLVPCVRPAPGSRFRPELLEWFADPWSPRVSLPERSHPAGCSLTNLVTRFLLQAWSPHLLYHQSVRLTRIIFWDQEDQSD